jgi:hypothetical protein
MERGLELLDIRTDLEQIKLVVEKKKLVDDGYKYMIIWISK